MDISTEVQNVIDCFGFDPRTIGLRHRGWWIVNEIDEEESTYGIQLGYLCIKARDGGDNPQDTSAYGKTNFVGSSDDHFDCTYRYYYFKPIDVPPTIVPEVEE